MDYCFGFELLLHIRQSSRLGTAVADGIRLVANSIFLHGLYKGLSNKV